MGPFRTPVLIIHVIEWTKVIQHVIQHVMIGNNYVIAHPREFRFLHIKRITFLFPVKFAISDGFGTKTEFRSSSKAIGNW